MQYFIKHSLAVIIGRYSCRFDWKQIRKPQTKTLTPICAKNLNISKLTKYEFVRKIFAMPKTIDRWYLNARHRIHIPSTDSRLSQKRP